jgi:kynurenine formamidase
MGMWIIDGCDFEVLAECCTKQQRGQFLFVGAPLRLRRATGSPLNPLAVF